MATLMKLIVTCRATEISSVSGNIIAEYKKADLSEDTYLTNLFELLIPATEKLTAAINRIKAKSDLEEKDKARDDQIRAINHLILGFLNHPDETINAAAQTAYKVFKHYGIDIIKENYSAESSLINSLLIDFSKEEIHSAITVLPGFSPMVEQLQIAQKEFNNEHILYEEKKAAERDEQTATDIKMEVSDIINNKLVVYLRAMSQAKADTYGPFANTVAQFINDNNVIVKKRRRGEEAEGMSSET